jgi:predicted transcriptional regulator
MAKAKAWDYTKKTYNVGKKGFDWVSKSLVASRTFRLRVSQACRSFKAWQKSGVIGE